MKRHDKTQNESALVCLARRGDRRALQELLRRNWDWLKGLVYSVLGDSRDLDDVLQDVCVRIIGKIDTLREPDRFRAWLAVLAKHVALRHARQRAKRPVSLDHRMADVPPDEQAGRFVEEPEKQELHEQILAAIEQLPQKYREVFMMAYAGDRTYAQIAETLDLPITTVQIRLVRARRMIQNLVAGANRQRVQ